MADEDYVNERMIEASLELAEQTARAETQAHDPITRIKAWATLRALERGKLLGTYTDFAEIVVRAVEEAMTRTEQVTGGSPREKEILEQAFADIARGTEIFVRARRSLAERLAAGDPE